MTQDYALRITAIDGATKVFATINKNMATVFRPAIQVQRQFGALTREMHIDKITKGLGSASRVSMKFAQNLGALTAPLEGLFGIGMAGGIAGAGAAVLGLGAKWGAMGFEINRTSKTLGLSADQLQLYRGMAKMAGLETDQMTSAMGNLGNVLHGTLWNGNAEAATVLRTLGIAIKKTPEGVVDTTAALVDLSRAISRIPDAHTQQSVAKVFGLEELLPLLRQGPEAMAKLGQAARDAGYVMGGPALKQADEYGKSIARLSTTAEAAGKIIASTLFTPLTNFAIRFLQRGIDVRKPNWGGATGGWGDDERSAAKQPGSASQHGTPQQRALLAQLEAANGLPGGMLTGVWGTESGFGANTGSSTAGARGHFQFMPETARRYGVTIGDFESEASGAARYLRDLHQERGSWSSALYGYNGVVRNTSAGEKYVQNVARNGDAGQGPLKIELQISGAPPGMSAQAKIDGSFLPTRINYNFPGGRP